MTGGRRLDFPIFESAGAAAGAMGVPEALLRQAKRQGCKAFISGSRVDTGVLIPYIFKMLQKSDGRPKGFSTWREYLEAERGKREAIKRRKDEGEMMPTAEAQRQAQEAMGMVFAELDRRDRELPPALAGLAAVDIFKRMTADTESIRKNLKLKFKEIEE